MGVEDWVVGVGGCLLFHKCNKKASQVCCSCHSINGCLDSVGMVCAAGNPTPGGCADICGYVDTCLCESHERGGRRHAV